MNKYSYNKGTKKFSKNLSTEITRKEIDQVLVELVRSREMLNLAKRVATECRNQTDLKRVWRIIASTDALVSTEILDKEVEATNTTIENIVSVITKANQDRGPV